jgi:hypothetical protein
LARESGPPNAERTTLRYLKGGVNLLLAIAIGAGLAFCCLEIIGAPLLIAVLWIARYAARHSSADLTIPFVGFGFGFAATVAAFAARTSGIFDGNAGSGSVYLFGFWFLVGCAMLGIGATFLMGRVKSRVAPQDGYRRG